MATSKNKPRVSVLRIGHRLVRDDRVSTHVGLVARAFGAYEIQFVDGDDDVKRTVDDVRDRFGGVFDVRLIHGWKRAIEEWKADGGIVVHLTMYGLPLYRVINKIHDTKKDILVVVGSRKVPSNIFSLTDYNVSVGNQPHSEISALAVFLDRLFEGEELKDKFPNHQVRIIPSNTGKNVEMRD